MKNLLFAFLCIGSLTLTSCSSNDDDDGNNDASLIGTWISNEVDDEYIVSLSITFNTNNTFSLVSSEVMTGETPTEDDIFTNSGTYSTSGNSITVTFIEDGITISSTSTFEINGNKLTITDSYEEDGTTYTDTTVLTKQ